MIAVLGTVFLICAGWGLARFWGWSSTRWRGWLRSGRAESDQIMERFRGWRRGPLKRIVAGWGRKQKVVDERDG